MGAFSATCIETTTPLVNNSESGLQSEVIIRDEAGGTITVAPLLRAQSITSLVLGTCNFFERKFLKNNQLEEAWQFRDNHWNNFEPTNKLVVIRDAEQLPVIDQIDFSMSPNFGLSLREFVNKSKLLSLTSEQSQEFGAGSLVLKLIPFDGETGAYSELVFAAHAGHLPAQYKAVSPNGIVLCDRKVKYCFEPNKNAYRICEINTVFDADPSIINQFRSLGLHAGNFKFRRDLVVKDFELLDASVIDREQMKWDSSWNIRDLTNPNIQENTMPKRTKILLLVSLLVVTVVAILVLRPKSASRNGEIK